MMNLKLATVFANMAELSKQKDGGAKTVIDFTRAARSIRDFPGNLEDSYKKGTLKCLPGIIPEMYGYLSEYFETGKIRFYEELKGDYSEELIKFIRISGLGKKRIFAIYEILGAKDIADLKEKISRKNSFKNILKSPKLEKDLLTKTHLERLVHSIDYYESTAALYPKGYIDFFINALVSRFKDIKDVHRVTVTGSLRRRKSFVSDIDLLVMTKSNLKGFDFAGSELFLKEVAKLPFIKTTGKRDQKHLTLSERFETTYGIDIEVIISSGPRWAADLFYTTGSKKHVRRIEELALKSDVFTGAAGLSIDSIYRQDNPMRDIISIFTEKYFNFPEKTYLSPGASGMKNYEEGQDYSDCIIYESLGLEYVPPELREDRGEIELAKRSALPVLVKPGDIKGDLHVHSFWSDGLIEVEDIKKSCKEMGYEYLALSDHSVSNTYGNGLDDKKMLEKIKYVKSIRKNIRDFKLLVGAEIDIRGVSLLDYDESIILKTDIALASMHSNYLNTIEENTARIIGALQNPLIDAIAHPTGLVFGARAPYVFDMERIFDAAVKYDKALEINSYLLRLDINDGHAADFKKMGGKVLINTDSHRPSNLAMMYLGVEVARRAGLERDDVINTRSLKELIAWKKNRHRY